MNGKIIVEKTIGENVYFEVEPLDSKYIDKMKFCAEFEADIEDVEQMTALRSQVLITASEEFEKLKNNVVL